jgi:S-adenosylmethionine hydrolase
MTLFLFTDYGHDGPYAGQLKAAALQAAPGLPVIDLMHDAPRFDARSASYLLAALLPYLPAGATVAAVVDPSVGTERQAHMAELDGRIITAPANGLLDIPLRHAATAALWRLDWRPQGMSASFHGRDLFAPAAAMLAQGARPGEDLAAVRLEPAPLHPGWPDDLAQVIYIDGFGNCMTGLRAARVPDAVMQVAGHRLTLQRTFADVPAGSPLLYENSQGLLEIAVNQGRADVALGLKIGSATTLMA